MERLASTVVGGGSKGGAEAFDPKTLSDVFEKTIKELTALDEKMQGRINKLEEFCAKEQEEHKQKAKELEITFKVPSSYHFDLVRATKSYKNLEALFQWIYLTYNSLP